MCTKETYESQQLLQVLLGGLAAGLGFSFLAWLWFRNKRRRAAIAANEVMPTGNTLPSGLVASVTRRDLAGGFAESDEENRATD
jgi:hypothetical protein